MNDERETLRRRLMLALDDRPTASRRDRRRGNA
jgi:hypothetical protein